MTQPSVPPVHTVARAGFANPLTLGILVTDPSYVVVYVDNTPLDPGQYVMTGVNDPNGVEITIPAATDPDWFPDALTITASFEPPTEQTADLSAGGVFGLAFEIAIDAIVRILLSLEGGLDRTLKVPFGVTGNITLPPPLPNSSIAWNSTGDGFVNGPSVEQIAEVSGYIPQIVAVANIAPQVVAVSTVTAELQTLAPLSVQIAALEPVAGAIAALEPYTDEMAALAPVAVQIGVLGNMPAEIAGVYAIRNQVTTVANDITSIVDVANNLGAILAAPGHAQDAADSAQEAANSAASVKWWKGTEAEYDAIDPKDPDMLYFIKE